jgi:hypothetical protein
MAEMKHYDIVPTDGAALVITAVLGEPSAAGDFRRWLERPEVMEQFRRFRSGRLEDAHSFACARSAGCTCR